MTSLCAPLQHLADILKPLSGQRIALIAPAGGVRDERIDTTVAVLQAAGIKIWLGDHARDHHRYLAGTTQVRLADLQSAFEQPDVAAVWCLRGGYGSAQLIDDIDWARIPADKPLIGYSDISALLGAFDQHDKYAVHAPTATDLAMPGNIALAQNRRADSIRSLVDRLQVRGHAFSLTHVAGPDAGVSGRMIGGNLTTLASLAGTSAALRLTEDSILMLEDIGEAEFRLERSLHQLLASIDTQRLVAVCLGSFQRCTLAQGMTSLTEIVAERLRPLDLPIYTGAPVGHGHHNLAWCYGATAMIERSLPADSRACLISVGRPSNHEYNPE